MLDEELKKDTENRLNDLVKEFLQIEREFPDKQILRALYQISKGMYHSYGSCPKYITHQSKTEIEKYDEKSDLYERINLDVSLLHYQSTKKSPWDKKIQKGVKQILKDLGWWNNSLKTIPLYQE